MSTFAYKINQKSFPIMQVLAGFCLLFYTSCNTQQEQKGNTSDNNSTTTSDTIRTQNTELPNSTSLIFEKDSVKVLPFEIDVKLSTKAIDKITKSKETIIVSASLRGTPKDTTQYSKDGLFGIGNFQKEITYGQPAKFGDISIPKRTFDKLADSILFININVYTGRKSSPDNLIDCDFIDDTLKNIINKTITLKGKLIGEGGR